MPLNPVPTLLIGRNFVVALLGIASITKTLAVPIHVRPVFANRHDVVERRARWLFLAHQFYGRCPATVPTLPTIPFEDTSRFDQLVERTATFQRSCQCRPRWARRHRI